MKICMQACMIEWRTEILSHIAGRKTNESIGGESHHGRDLIREIRSTLNPLNDCFTRNHREGVQ
jgi:hypothetical protein